MGYIKKNGRSTYRSSKRSPYSKSSNYKIGGSYFNKTRSKGSASQLREKYTKLAKESAASGDRIQSEFYWQFADHYSRAMIESGIKPSFDIEKNHYSSSDKNTDNLDQKQDEKNLAAESQEINESENIENESNEDEDSLEKIPFISKIETKLKK